MHFIQCVTVCSQSGRADEILQLTLQETCRLPILLYASPGYSFKERHLSELNACWNAMYRKIFNFNQWESVKSCINGLGRLDFHHILLLQRLKFYKRLCVSTNYFMRYLFWKVFINNLQSEMNIEHIFHTWSEHPVFVRNEFNCMCVSL
jgi:hypothetical protein